jgi:hypothetical protein
MHRPMSNAETEDLGFRMSSPKLFSRSQRIDRHNKIARRQIDRYNLTHIFGFNLRSDLHFVEFMTPLSNILSTVWRLSAHQHRSQVKSLVSTPSLAWERLGFAIISGLVDNGFQITDSPILEYSER